MKAVVCKKFAPVSDLVWEEVADPVAGPGEIVIDVKAAGLSRQSYCTRPLPISTRKTLLART